MVQARWISGVIFGSLLMCFSHTTWAVGKKSAALDFDGDYEQSNMEVPVESIQQFVQIYGIVKENYLKEKADDDLFQQAIQGLVSGLDRYSRYLSPEDYKQLLQYTEGDLAAVDFDLHYDAVAQHWLIHNLKKDADSAKQGLSNGMVVYKMDDQELKKLSHAQVKQLLDGAIGSTVSLQLTTHSKPIYIVRNTKIETDIESRLLNNQVLVLTVKVFQQDTANEVKRIIESHNGSKLKAILFDLRNNPGGLLSAAVESADLFLNQGVIVSTRSRSEGDQQFQALPSFEFQNMKVGILINGRSASAAEVFTVALKEHGRAWVVGEKSYGKGVVQKLFPLSNGAALQMTVSQYYTPNGRMIEGIGVQPDFSYPQHEMSEQQYLEHVTEQLLNKK